MAGRSRRSPSSRCLSARLRALDGELAATSDLVAPPREHLRLTQPIVDGATSLDVKLHDHIIVGNGGRKWVSLAQRGAL